MMWGVRAALALWSLWIARPEVGPSSCALAGWAMGRGPRPEPLDVEVIALEERAASPARRAWGSAEAEIWIRRLKDGESLVMLANLASSPVSVDVIWKELGLGLTRATPRVRDVLQRRNLGKIHGGFARRLEPGACALFRVEP